jgi:predicted RNase H-like nuclease (RuvC/YqgF family)
LQQELKACEGTVEKDIPMLVKQCQKLERARKEDQRVIHQLQEQLDQATEELGAASGEREYRVKAAEPKEINADLKESAEILGLSLDEFKDFI